jgi:hypothetical protein
LAQLISVLVSVTPTVRAVVVTLPGITEKSVLSIITIRALSDSFKKSMNAITVAIHTRFHHHRQRRQGGDGASFRMLMGVVLNPLIPKVDVRKVFLITHEAVAVTIR